MAGLRHLNLYNLCAKTTLLLALLLSNICWAEPLFELKKVGEARLSVLFWDIYDSALYTQSGVYRSEEFPQALDIVYLRDIESIELIENTKEEWQKLGINDEDSVRWLGNLTQLLPNIKKGDRLTLVVNTHKHSEFFLNSNSIGSVCDAKFGPAFLRIWLDAGSSYPKVRRKLIGKN
tara:strand:- start:3848 stop:4378 length:531 start_codon:yes stop_codon:yes gene_type:complete